MIIYYPYKCALCGTEVTGTKMRFHLRSEHPEFTPIEGESISKTYYDKYMKTSEEGTCSECDAPTKWKGLRPGYDDTCSRKCACTMHRRNLREDPEKFESFRTKVVDNQSRIWAEREETGEKDTIMSKATVTKNEWISTLTDQERKEAFGWLNKLTDQEKKLKVEEILNKSLRKWYKESSQEVIDAMYARRRETLNKTWDTRGKEIMDLMTETFLKNKDAYNDGSLEVELSDEFLRDMDALIGIVR